MLAYIKFDDEVKSRNREIKITIKYTTYTVLSRIIGNLQLLLYAVSQIYGSNLRER